MYRVRGKGLANVWRMYRVQRKGWRMSGKCIESGESSWRMSGRMYRVRPIFQKRAFWRVLAFAKLANFWRVLEFDKFAGEWPLLSFFAKKKHHKICVFNLKLTEKHFLNMIPKHFPSILSTCYKKLTF